MFAGEQLPISVVWTFADKVVIKHFNRVVGLDLICGNRTRGLKVTNPLAEDYKSPVANPSVWPVLALPAKTLYRRTKPIQASASQNTINSNLKGGQPE